MKKLLTILICFSILLSVVSCNGDTVDSSQQGSVDATSSTTSNDVVEDVKPFDPPEDPTAKMNEALDINSDVVGWISIPGTNIDYPVLQDPNGKNNPPDPNILNQYYNNRNIHKQKSRNAVIFGDDWCTFGDRTELSRNTVLYGHNWTNIEANGAPVRLNDDADVMFAQLLAFSDYDFAKKSPAVYFSTPTDNMTWVVFAAFYTDTSFEYILENPSDKQFIGIINGAKSRSQYKYNVDVMLNDKIITLSTCTRRLGSTDKQRFVVMARLMRDGESITDFGVPVINESPKRPSWYTGNR